MAMRKHIVRWSILFLIGVSIGLLFTYREAGNSLDDGITPLSPDDVPAATVSKEVKSHAARGTINLGGPFSLTDHNGKAVTEKDYAGSYKLLFFGFTFCPMVCPTELQKMTLIMNELGEAGAKIQPLFITVDPERDDVEAIKIYVEQFHPRLIGLTGTREQIDDVMNAYRVYATKVENEMMDGYMINHSAYTYLMDPEDELIAIYPAKDTAMDIVNDIKGRAL